MSILTNCRSLSLAFLALCPNVPATHAEEEMGLAANYPGDIRIQMDTATVMVEDFEAPGVAEIGKNWTETSNHDGNALTLSADVPPGTPGQQSLKITATHGKDTGGHLFKVLKPGYDQLYIRFYVKFAADHGYINHFVKLQGSINPPNWTEGEAGHKHVNSFSTGLEPQKASYHTYPPAPFAPPGIWHFYSYWPEMRSWQNPDGTGTSFYGNDFEPETPAIVPRNKWQCVEFMVKMNSSPEKSDGEQAFWIDGQPKGHFAPGSVKGYWMREVFRLDDEKGKPFEGIRWRTDPRININKVWLLHYVNFNEGTKDMNTGYLAAHPDSINMESSSVWFDHLVVARKYIGPITPLVK